MGISGWIFDNLKQAYPQCFTKVIPPELREGKYIGSCDEQFLVKIHSDWVNTVHLLKKTIVGAIVSQMRRRDLPCPYLIALFDRWSPDAKSIKTHTERDKDIEPLLYDPNKPYLDERNPHQVLEVLQPKKWLEYTANRELVRRELYPIIWNAFMDEAYYVPAAGEQLILHGLPGQWRVMADKLSSRVENPHELAPEVEFLCPRERITPEHEKRDPDLYNRVFVIVQGRRYQWKEACNDIGEADLAIVKYWEMFPPTDTHVVFMDDGDALPISLLHTFDRTERSPGKFWICKPRVGMSKKV